MLVNECENYNKLFESMFRFASGIYRYYVNFVYLNLP